MLVNSTIKSSSMPRHPLVAITPPLTSKLNAPSETNSNIASIKRKHVAFEASGHPPLSLNPTTTDF
jgi:hypothetical protein